MLASIFLDFNIPNSATWFYFSLLLAIGLFVNFGRLLTLRNFDLLALYLIAPGFLILQEAHTVYGSARGQMQLSIGYIWLIAASGYWFARCVFDLGLVKRPSLNTNLNIAGLAWLAAALFVCMTVVAIRRIPDAPIEHIGKEPIALARVQEGATAVVSYQTGSTDLDRADAKFWIERGIAMSLHLAVLVGLVLISAVHFQNILSGTAMACLYLLMPCTAFHISQMHHVWPAVFLVWAVFAYRAPIVAGILIGWAAGSAFFPLLLFPLWFGFYRGRGAARFAGGFALAATLSLALTALVLWSDGNFNRYVRTALSLSDWQAWKEPHTESLWIGAHWAYRMPVFILYMAFVVLTAFWPTPRNLAQVIAQSAAVVIGVQFWYADQGGVYVLWYLPMLLLMIFRPNLSERRPPTINPETDRLTRWARAARERLRRLIIRDTRQPVAAR